jgi:N6-L-threonylcarbamoyladenine synthase
VVPEIAARAHVEHLDRVIARAMEETELQFADLDGIAAAAGPGLIGGVIVGLTTAKAIALGAGKPLIAVNHLEAHALTARLTDNVAFPFLLLLVSGGHTQLVVVDDVGRYRLIGGTVDDAVGEAFDKTAKMLGLPYPGGPALARLAGEGRPDRFAFPRPMIDRPGLDLSFSGLKTAVVLEAKKLAGPAGLSETDRVDLANSFQEAVVDTLVAKCTRAMQSTGLQRLVVAGGVGANQRLRQRLRHELTAAGCRVYYPRSEFCTDNGAMIALTGCLRFPSGGSSSAPSTVQARARWEMEELRQP